jgi:hypothetical protein
MKHFPVKLVLLIALASGFLSFFITKKTTNTVNESSNIQSKIINNQSGVAVLELYTSEGCSSCPPADDVLRGVVSQDNVFALAFHVTYWNRLGWKDSFSQKIFDERQYNYGAQFKKEGVYTPQLVVNGTEEFVGSRKTQAENAIKKALAMPAKAQIKLSKTLKDNDISVKYKLTGDYKDATLNFAVVESNFATKVLRGENEGQTLKHDNVVRDFETIEVTNTEGVQGIFPLKNWRIQNCALIVFLQDKKTRQAIGAAKILLN